MMPYTCPMRRGGLLALRRILLEYVCVTKQRFESPSYSSSTDFQLRTMDWSSSSNEECTYRRRKIGTLMSTNT